MSKSWTPQSLEIYQSWIDALQFEASDKLTDWEFSFIESIENQLSNGRNLTENQANKLEQLYARHTN